MSRGTVYDVTGHLNRGEAMLPILRVDGGGTWRLDTAHSLTALYGKRVRVVGTRADFDLLDVRTIEIVPNEGIE